MRAANAIGLPVVLKGITPRSHASRQGRVSLRSICARRPTCARHSVDSRARAAELSAPLDGVYVQKMHPRGTELLVTAFRDPMFGVMVSCGSGGVFTELIDDVVTERAPVGVELAAHMLERLRTTAPCDGFRGVAPDRSGRAVHRALRRARADGARGERFVFEVNPVLWRRDDAVAVDGLLIVGPDEAAFSERVNAASRPAGASP